MSTFVKTFEAYQGPIRDEGTAADIDAMLADWTPALDIATSLYEKERSIESSVDLTAEGREKALKAVAAERAAAATIWLPKLTARTQAIRTELETTMTAADLGLERYGTGWVRKKASNDPAREREYRDRWFERFGPQPAQSSEAREKYRGLVTAGDDRAGLLEYPQDPTGEIVSEVDRQWARDFRCAHSPLADRIRALHAMVRSYTLLLDSASREFRPATPLGV